MATDTAAGTGMVTGRGPGPGPGTGTGMVTDAAPVLQVRGLRKHFGAVKATDGVDLTLLAGEIHALIGPNGAGKSTLISQLSGELRPDAGSIEIDGVDVTTAAAWQRARKGLSRSFQITELCPDYSALENVLLSLVLRNGRAYGAWRDPRRDPALAVTARRWLDDVGLGPRAGSPVSGLAHGEKRQLELAVALAREPRILLLDEPMAGMGAEETAKMTAQLQALKGRYSILLVEHDMEAVFALADRITVLVYGRTIFTGTPAEVRAHPEVKAAYLGEDTVADELGEGKAADDLAEEAL